MKIVACGITGLVGRPLAKALSQKYDLVCLRRKLSSGGAATLGREVLWDPSRPGEWTKELEGAYAVINLSGEPIAGKRWTQNQKNQLRDSRVQTTKTIVDAIIQAKARPKVLLNASAIGFYGSRGNEILNEESAGGSDFLSGVCAQWEKEARRAESFDVRVVNLRTGIVLAREGGALAKMITPFRMFLGGPLGSGEQMMSWVHIEDEVGGILKALEDNEIRGPLNLTAPNPVTMGEFARTLGHVMRRPSVFPVPGFVLKILLGEMSALLLTGQRVQPQKLTQRGFHFRHETLDHALRSLV